MATVTKDFRVKAGLVVEGSTATVAGHDVLTEGLVDAKGDLLVASGADAVTRVALGTNGYILTADDSQTAGVKWAAAPAVGTFESSVTFEGPTADSFETTLTVTDPSADRTITLPDATGTVALTSDITSAVDALDTDDIEEGSTNKYFTDERAQDAVGNAVTNGITYTDSTGALGLNYVTVGNTLIDGVSGSSYGIIGTSTYLDVKDTNGYNKEIELDIAAVKSTLNSDGYVTTSSTSTLTNKTLTSPKINEDVAVTATATELNVLDGITASTAELNILDGVTSTAAELNILDGATLSTTELNYVDGVTSSIQTQLNAKFETANALTTNIAEGINLYFTDERAQDAIGNNVGNGLDYDDSSGAISVDPSEFALTSVGAPTGNLSLATYKITSLGTPTDATDAATKAYVDSVTEGLHIHEAAVAATTVNVNLSNALENGDTLDGITLATGDRILVKNQTTTSENGIYVVQASGQPTRATDFDTAAEVDSGDFIFVYSGTVNGSTGWVQTNKPAIIGTDAILFTQFSGAGTYLAGNGLTLTGNSFSINTGVTVDLNTAQTLTNKSISGSANTLSNIPNSSLDNSAITINGTSTSLGGSRTLGSDDIAEGSTNKYFTDEKAQDAVGNAVGTGLAYNDSTGALSNTGVLSVTGTANQVVADASTGAVTLSLPQSIHTAATPTFGGVTVGSVTLADALVGSALATASTSATTIDTWSATTYSSAKYLVQMKNGNDIEVLELLVTVDGNNNVYLTEYADVMSNTELGTTNAVYSSGNVLLQVTGASADTAVKVVKTYIEA